MKNSSNQHHRQERSVNDCNAELFVKLFVLFGIANKQNMTFVKRFPEKDFRKRLWRFQSALTRSRLRRRGVVGCVISPRKEKREKEIIVVKNL